jgi:hypothetical protein
MPITAIRVLAVLGMGVLLLMQPLSSVDRWWGRSTAGPSHYRNNTVRCSITLFFQIPSEAAQPSSRFRFRMNVRSWAGRLSLKISREACHAAAGVHCAG